MIERERERENVRNDELTSLNSNRFTEQGFEKYNWRETNNGEGITTGLYICTTYPIASPAYMYMPLQPHQRQRNCYQRREPRHATPTSLWREVPRIHWIQLSRRAQPVVWRPWWWWWPLWHRGWWTEWLWRKIRHWWWRRRWWWWRWRWWAWVTTRVPAWIARALHLQSSFCPRHGGFCMNVRRRAPDQHGNHDDDWNNCLE